LLWFLGGAILLYQQQHPQADGLLMDQMHELLEECYRSQLSQLPRQEWAEYFDGPTGAWIGQQARTYQTWTVVGFLLMHHLLRVKPSDATILDLGAT
jgi:beta-fructofuranosidase